MLIKTHKNMHISIKALLKGHEAFYNWYTGCVYGFEDLRRSIFMECKLPRETVKIATKQTLS